MITRIESFSLENNYDFVRIYDGLASAGSLLAQLSGNMSSIGSVLSNENTVQIQFTRYIFWKLENNIYCLKLINGHLKIIKWFEC